MTTAKCEQFRFELSFDSDVERSVFLNRAFRLLVANIKQLGVIIPDKYLFKTHRYIQHDGHQVHAAISLPDNELKIRVKRTDPSRGNWRDRFTNEYVYKIDSNEIVAIESKIKKLLDGRLDGMVDDDEFIEFIEDYCEEQI